MEALESKTDQLTQLMSLFMNQLPKLTQLNPPILESNQVTHVPPIPSLVVNLSQTSTTTNLKKEKQVRVREGEKREIGLFRKANFPR